MRSGLDAADAPRVNRLARGHPLSLELAAAAVRARPDADLEDHRAAGGPRRADRALPRRPRPAPTREALTPPRSSAAPRSRCSRRCCPTARRRTRSSACARCRSSSSDTTASSSTTRFARRSRGRCAGSDPAVHRRYRAAAWRTLQNELPSVAPADLWRYTADMLYLIENPTVREAFFPTTEHAYWLEDGDSRGRRGDRRRSSAVTSRRQLPRTCSRGGSSAPQGFRVVRDRDGASWASRCCSSRIGFPTARSRPIP